MYIKSKKGITLIALIITVIIMLILAGVIIWQVTDQDGFISKILNGTNKHSESQAKEELQIYLSEWELEKRTNENADFNEFFKNKGYKVIENQYDYVVEKMVTLS